MPPAHSWPTKPIAPDSGNVAPILMVVSVKPCPFDTTGALIGDDPPAAGTMDRPPRPRGAAILTVRRLGRMTATGAVMAAGTLGVLAFGMETGSEDHALALAFTTFVLFQVFNALCARSETASVFHRDTLRNGKLWAALVAVVALQAAAVHIDVVQDVFGTADFTLWDWALSAGVASTVLWFDEARKAFARRG